MHTLFDISRYFTREQTYEYIIKLQRCDILVQLSQRDVNVSSRFTRNSIFNVHSKIANVHFAI